MFLAVPQWVGRNTSDTGHFKPFFYYTKVVIGPEFVAVIDSLVWKGVEVIKAVWGTDDFTKWLIVSLRKNVLGNAKIPSGVEPHLILGLLLPVLYAACSPRKWMGEFGKSDKAFGGFLFVWALLSWAVYSYVKYKTPWLVINLTLPSILFLAWMGEFGKSDNAFGRFLFVWALLSWAVYSYVKYKTPWLVINLTLPSILFLAWFIPRSLANIRFLKVVASVSLLAVLWFLIDASYNYRGYKVPYALYGVGGVFVVIFAISLFRLGIDRRFRYAAVGAFLSLMIFVAGLFSWRYNFHIPYGKRNPLSYVHSHEGLLSLVKDVKAYIKKHPKASVLIGVQGYWPLPYYFRNISSKLGYLVTKDPKSQSKRYQILIMDHDVDFKDDRWARKYYRISDVQETQTYFQR